MFFDPCCNDLFGVNAIVFVRYDQQSTFIKSAAVNAANYRCPQTDLIVATVSFLVDDPIKYCHQDIDGIAQIFP